MLKTEFKNIVREVLDQELEGEASEKRIIELTEALVARVEIEFGLDADDEMVEDRPEDEDAD